MVEIEVVPSIPRGPRPKVSVIVTTYNHERFIAQALDGALQQRTSFPFEVVVGEDCSTDGTRAIVEHYHRRHPDVLRLVLPSANLGPNQMYLEVMRVARGEYFALLDGDDYWVSIDKLERQVALLDDHPDVSVCFHDATVVMDDGSGDQRPSLPDPTRSAFDLSDILLGDFVPTLSVMHRSVDPADLPPWVTEFAWMDWLMLIHCAQRGRLVCLSDIEAVRRVHDDGLWSSRDWKAQLAECIAIYERLQHVLPAEAQGAVKDGSQRCRVQLAVEDVSVPFGARIVVLGPAPTLPWYFNGRLVENVSISDTDDATAALLKLRQLRRRPAPSRIRPHWRTIVTSMTDPLESTYAVVLESAVEVLDQERLEGALRPCACVYRDASCTIYRLPRQRVLERRVTYVLQAKPGMLRGHHIDHPKEGTVTVGATLELIGWALSDADGLMQVSLRHGDALVHQSWAQVHRPDLAAAFPAVLHASTAGFRGLVDLADLPESAELVVEAIQHDGRRQSLGRLMTAPTNTS